MISLKGQFLVAMPEMGDERFKDSVIFRSEEHTSELQSP